MNPSLCNKTPHCCSNWSKCFYNSYAARQVLPGCSYVFPEVPHFRITLSISVFQFPRKFLSWKLVAVAGWGLCEWTGCPLRETGRGTACSSGTARPCCSTPPWRRTPRNTSSTTWASFRGGSTAWTSSWRVAICRARPAVRAEQVSMLIREVWKCKMVSWALWTMRKKKYLGIHRGISRLIQ